MVERQTGKGPFGDQSISCISNKHGESWNEEAKKVNIHETWTRVTCSLDNAGNQVKHLGTGFEKRKEIRESSYFLLEQPM